MDIESVIGWIACVDLLIGLLFFLYCWSKGLTKPHWHSFMGITIMICWPFTLLPIVIRRR